MQEGLQALVVLEVLLMWTFKGRGDGDAIVALRQT
jgi:hypothetical protein